MYHQYDRAVQTVLDYLSEQGFSSTVRKGFRRATREFKVYLETKPTNSYFFFSMYFLQAVH